MCALKLHLTDGQALVIIGAYRPPNRDTLNAQNLFDTITDISARNPNSFICYAGDFNLPDIDWDTESVSSYRYRIISYFRRSFIFELFEVHHSYENNTLRII